MQSDPIGLNGGQWSTYGYVGGNPLTQIDPTGTNALTGIRIGAMVCGWPCALAGGLIVGDALDSAAQDAISEPPFSPGVGINGEEAPAGAPMQMAAPGNVADTQIAKDYGEYASAQRLCGSKPDDPCDWLEKNKSRYRPDQVKATQKAWGCRGSRHGKGGKPRG